MVLDVVASAVIGGVSIYGGGGTVLGAAVGAMFITVVGNGLNLLGLTILQRSWLRARSSTRWVSTRS